MSAMIPAYHDAKRDRALMGAPLIIYLDLLDDLDLSEFRPVKQLALGVELDLSERAIRGSLKLLVDRGYLERAPVKGGESRRYRLTYSRARAAD